MPHKSERLPFTEKVGYAMGDTAANLIFQTMVILQLAFYTDTFGITAAAAGTLLVVVRFWDAIFDPIMGVVSDRTKTRWGKFRPWILWTAVPFGIMGFLTFMTPDLGPSGKLVYAYVTYIVLMMVYSANNLPYSALSGVMTGDLGERTSLSQYRFFFAMVGQLVVQGLALPMVVHFGQGNSALGYKWTMAIFGAVAIVLFLVTFSSTKERIQPPKEQKATLAEHFADLKGNGPWLAMFVLTLILFITLAMRGGDVVYYFRYYADPAAITRSLAWVPEWLRNLLGGTDAPTLGFSVFNLLGTTATIIGLILSKGPATRFGKRNVFIFGLIGTALFCMPFMVLPNTSITLMIVSEVLRQFIYGFTIPLLWAMMADVADYSEWKNHRRATGMVFAAIVFALKAGLGFGGAITGWLLSVYGYVPNVAQTVTSLNGIRLIMSLYPAITFAICAAILLFYPIDLRAEIQITDELAERRRLAEAATLPAIS
jgi:GPH family glycoside/pentoside/hexuronide:cation symporter